mmetsp:Transcript_13621/g.27060  ORF Transcript_13621/g.27060 Transcript_13621/m.27060 type:complete len:448 (+) Transcript_13621:187-1530(+)
MALFWRSIHRAEVNSDFFRRLQESMETNDDIHLSPERVGTAFLLTTVAGLCTGIGAAISFFLKFEDKRIFTICLSLAGGVMLYVSFLEIFMKGQEGLIQGGVPEDMSYVYATLLFFGGIGLSILLNWISEIVFHRKGPLKRKKEKEREVRREANTMIPLPAPAVGAQTVMNAQSRTGEGEQPSPLAAQEAEGERERDPQREGSNPTGLVGPILPPAAAQTAQTPVDPSDTHVEEAERGVPSVTAEALQSPAGSAHRHDGTLSSDHGGEGEGRLNSSPVDMTFENEHTQALTKLGCFSALALAAHNMPEGFATFVAALVDVRVGIGLMIAIAIHNIPEGIAVAVPVYYGSGSRWKAFGYSMISGLAEPLGAAIGYGVMLASGGFSEIAFSVVFGLVGGLMVYIVIEKLLPTAISYDPTKGWLTSRCFFLGMIVMAFSLVLFQLFPVDA